MFILALISLISAALSWYAVNRLIVILTKRQIIDIPNDRTLHKGSIPRGGGLAIVALILLSLVVVGALSTRYFMFAGIFISVLAWSSLSWLDDRFDLSPRRRWLVQCVFATLSVMAFGAVDTVHLSNERY